jgi:acetyl-CoA acetyltransferase
MTWEFHRKTAITGIGHTDFTRASGRSVLDLALEACAKAIDDAGIDIARVDGIVTYALNDSVYAQAVATGLGLPYLGYYENIDGGGNTCVSSLTTAASLVGSGMAKNVLVFRAMNGRSGHRLGGTDNDGMFQAAGEAQYTMPFGWMSYPQYIAMAARRHMIKYGTTSEDFGRVAVTQRRHAQLNDRAMMRSPLTLEDHQASRLIADPLHLYDICLETDGACATVVSGIAEARDLRHEPVEILGGTLGGGKGSGYGLDGFFMTDDMADCYAIDIAESLWANAGVSPEDIDVASIYDCFTYSVITQLEGFGFCKPGEGAAFVRDGQMDLDGTVAVNPHGGMLSEAYIHGLNGVIEMVYQLRGESGERQRPGARTALATGFGVTTGCAVVLGT